MSRKSEFIQSCVFQYNELRDAGNKRPSCQQIADQMMAKKKGAPKELVDAVTDALRRILTRLRELEPNILVTTVAEQFYQKYGKRALFTEVPPQDEDECKHVAPLGRAKHSAGIYTADGPDDIYWLHMNRHHRHSASRSTSEGTRRLVVGKQAGHIQLRPARKEARKTLDTVIPANLAELGNLSEGDNGALNDR